MCCIPIVTTSKAHIWATVKCATPYTSDSEDHLAFFPTPLFLALLEMKLWFLKVFN